MVLASLLAAILLVLAVASLRWFLDTFDSPKDHCRTLLAELQRTVNPQELRQASAEILQRFSDGGDHRVPNQELPEPIRRVMTSLRLGEATVSGGQVLRLWTPGGFAGYGVDVVPQALRLTASTNSLRLTEIHWKDGIYAWYQNL